MAHTTRSVADSRGLIERLEQEIAKRGVPDGYQYETLDHDVRDEPEPAQGTVTIKIKVKSGTVTGTGGIPDGYYQCEILDCDVESKPKREALYLATVNILVRATSPGHAAGIIIFALSDYDRDDDRLVDWDYAVQDGERQLPKCVSLDLEPGNITELLDRMATRGE